MLRAAQVVEHLLLASLVSHVQRVVVMLPASLVQTVSVQEHPNLAQVDYMSHLGGGCLFIGKGNSPIGGCGHALGATDSGSSAAGTRQVRRVPALLSVKP